MRITGSQLGSAGYVGIGNSNPQTALDVNGITSSTGFLVQGVIGAGTSTGYMLTGSPTTDVGGMFLTNSINLYLGWVTGNTRSVNFINGGSTRWAFNSTDVSPASAAGMTLGTTSLPWGNSFIQGLTIGAAGLGTNISRHLSATASLNFAATAAGTCDLLTITVTGAADGDTVVLGVPTALAASDNYQSFNGYVSAADTVTVKRCNLTNAVTALSDPAAATVRADVWKH
jgi:hypothetical protein